MVLFSEIVLQILIYGALGLTALGFLTLVFLILRDKRNRSIW